jgi:type I restriction enzyme M protein
VNLDILEAVIGLGHNLFYNSAMISCILVLRNNKENNRKGKVIFIDAEEDVTRKNAQSYLSDDQIKKILDAYNNFEDIQGYAKVALNKEINDSGSVLSISYYVEGIKNEDYNSETAINDWSCISDASCKEVGILSKMLLDYGE